MNPDSERSEDRVELPTAFAEHVASVDDIETPPTTLEEWWTVLAEQFSETDQSVTLDDLYSEEPTRHEVQVDGRINYAHCAIDALAAAVLEDQAEVTVRSVDPVTHTPITFSVGAGSIEASHPDALVCFGANLDDADVASAGSFAEWSVQDDKTEVKATLCQYTNAFENRASYDRWLAKTDATTALPLSPEKAVQLMQQLFPATAE